MPAVWAAPARIAEVSSEPNASEPRQTSGRKFCPKRSSSSASEARTPATMRRGAFDVSMPFRSDRVDTRTQHLSVRTEIRYNPAEMLGQVYPAQ